MTSDAILKQINELFVQILNDPTIKLVPETTAKDIPKWDSLNHIKLVVAIENHFNLRFEYSQLLNWKNLKSICEDVEKILSERN